MKVAVRQIKNELSKYGQLAHEGDRIVVTKNGNPWFDLVPHRAGERCVESTEGVKAVVSSEVALAPFDAEDLPGWS